MNKLHWVFLGLKLSLPFLWKAAIATFELVAITIFKTWKSLFELVDDVASNWTEKAILSGLITSEYNRLLYYLLYAVALVVVFAGWVITAHLTIILFNYIF